MWKWIGLAGVIGVAAVGAGVLISRRTREYENLDDAELSERLHQRLAEARSRSSREHSGERNSSSAELRS